MSRSIGPLLHSATATAGELTPGPGQRVVVLSHHPLLERNNGVVSDFDLLRTDLRAALGDVAHADPGARLDQLQPVIAIQRMHLQSREADKEPRPSKAAFVALMVADDVADILAQEAFDALVELLDPVHVILEHA